MKLKPVEQLPGAQHDLEQSAAWYEEQEPGVGERFLAAVILAEGKLQRNPEWGVPDRRNTRKWRVPPFPHSLVYRIEDDRIVIIAVAHGSRPDDYWDDRLN